MVNLTTRNSPFTRARVTAITISKAIPQMAMKISHPATALKLSPSSACLDASESLSKRSISLVMETVTAAAIKTAM